MDSEAPGASVLSWDDLKASGIDGKRIATIRDIYVGSVDIRNSNPVRYIFLAHRSCEYRILRQTCCSHRELTIFTTWRLPSHG